MAKPLLNYTTSVEVEKTVAEIARILVGHGATTIQTVYTAGRPTAVSFAIDSPRGGGLYRLPTRADRVLFVLGKQHKAGLVQPRFVNGEQAARVAWRIVKDWIEAQLALVSAGMVDVDEILLPYQVENQTGPTFYEAYVAHKQLEGPNR